MLDPKTLEAVERLLTVRISKLAATENPAILTEIHNEIRSKRSAIETELESTGKSFDACHTTAVVEKRRNVTKYRCSGCGGSWTVYRIYFSSHHIRILKKIFAYCVKNRTHEFDKKAIPDLTASDYTNFCHLQRFGLLYWITDDVGKKQKGGRWGANVGRIRKFLGGEWAVAEYSEKDTLTQEQRTSEARILISQVKRYGEEKQAEDRAEWLPYFISYDADPFDRKGYHSVN